ncbi:MAG: hypothetical protein Q8Q42_04330 [Nanoarchaeota archaeon]|nr:hypothetical protein [Nanoarchaeota archaeon]
MRRLTRSCCSLELKPLNENQRDSLLGKILRIAENKNRGLNALDVAKEIRILKKEGYDVDSYSVIFWGFIQRYGLGI